MKVLVNSMTQEEFNRKEKENMDTSKMFNFDFGPVDARIRIEK